MESHVRVVAKCEDFGREAADFFVVATCEMESHVRVRYKCGGSCREAADFFGFNYTNDVFNRFFMQI